MFDLEDNEEQNEQVDDFDDGQESVDPIEQFYETASDAEIDGVADRIVAFMKALESGQNQSTVSSGDGSGVGELQPERPEAGAGGSGLD